MEILSQTTSRGRIRHSKNLTSYVTGTLGATAFFAAPQSEAAVTAVTFGFGSQLDLSDGDGLTSRQVGSFGNLSSNLSADLFSLSRVYHNNSTMAYGEGLISFFANGTVIGGGGVINGFSYGTGLNGFMGSAYFQGDHSLLNLTVDQLNQNIGFMTDTNNWGWANVSWNNTAKTLTINSAYVESVAGNSITVGDTGISSAPEPRRVLLALAGLGGVMLRRRRKQVA